jgi:hypothetical protein
MTLREAAEQGIQRLRREEWGPTAYLRLDLVTFGSERSAGPWGHLYDRGTQEATGAETPQDVLLLGADAGAWLPYEGALDRTDAGPGDAGGEGHE